MRFNEKEVELLQEAGAKVEIGREYTQESTRLFQSEVIDYVMSHSKSEISQVRNRYGILLQKLD